MQNCTTAMLHSNPSFSTLEILRGDVCLVSNADSANILVVNYLYGILFLILDV